MEIFKQNIAYECAPLRASSRALAEGTLSPPPGMPPMARILSIDGRAGGSGEAVEGKLMIDGAVTLSVLYLCEEGKSHGFEPWLSSSTPWTSAARLLVCGYAFSAASRSSNTT